MSSISSLLPKPKHVDTSQNAESRTVDTTEVDADQKRAPAHIPPYGKRAGWKPRTQQDYGDGGAYPECLVAQYPLNMGRKQGQETKSNAMSVQYDNEGNVRYDVVARRGHDNRDNVMASYKDLIPLRNQSNAGELDLTRPTDERVEETTKSTKDALDQLLNNKLAKSRPRNVTKRPNEATYVRYTPASQMGNKGKSQQRIIRVQDHQQDPLQPARFKQTAVPDPAPEAPPPVLHAPRKATAKEREDWYIPPAVSNWKNPKGFAVALDKRVAASGRGMQDQSINERQVDLAEAMFGAEEAARKEIRERSAMRRKIAERENAAKEEQLREMARQAREEHQNRPKPEPEEVEEQGNEEYEAPKESKGLVDYDSDESGDDNDEAAQKRAEQRKDRQLEREREMRMSRMGNERKVKAMVKDQDRDISERVALGLAKPSMAGDSRFDSRLFNHGPAAKYNEDQLYDTNMFAQREALGSIYKSRGGAGVSQEDAEERIKDEHRFDALGKAKKGFKGADKTEPSEGPVEFERAVETSVDKEDDNETYGLEPSRKRQKR